jgi:hypothetical protein
MSAAFPRKYSTIPPPKLLARRTSTGKTGNSELKPIDAVIPKPLKRRIKETVRPARGPASAKSNIAFELGGGDLNGVIAPVKPVVIEGTKFGRPMSNYKKEEN